MTRRIPVEDAILEPEAWEAPERLTSDDLYFVAGGDHRQGHSSFEDREDDR